MAGLTEKERNKFAMDVFLSEQARKKKAEVYRKKIAEAVAYGRKWKLGEIEMLDLFREEQKK